MRSPPKQEENEYRKNVHTKLKSELKNKNLETN